MTDEPEIKIIPFGKRGEAVLKPAPPSTIRLTTQTALEAPQRQSRVPIAKGDRRTAQERVEAAERKEALSVALAQPHREGSDDPRLAFPLGRFCLKAWPRDQHFRDAMHAAGASYATDLRAVRVARGFHVVGSEREGKRYGETIDEPTSEEIAQLRANIEGMERALANADSTLRDIMPRCPGAMVRLCFDHIDPSPYDEAILKHGLYRLAKHYGHWKEGAHT